MKTRLKELGAPTYGTKEILWTRIVQFTRYARAEKALKEQLARDAAARAEGTATEVPRIIPAPVAPSDAERKAHEVTHVPAKPWCD